MHNTPHMGHYTLYYMRRSKKEKRIRRKQRKKQHIYIPSTPKLYTIFTMGLSSSSDVTWARRARFLTKPHASPICHIDITECFQMLRIPLVDRNNIGPSIKFEVFIHYNQQNEKSFIKIADLLNLLGYLRDIAFPIARAANVY